MKTYVLNILIIMALIPYAVAENKKTYDKPPVIDPNEFKVLLETADDPLFQHPVNSVEIGKGFDHDGGYSEWKKWPIMSMSKSDILKLVPKQVGLLHLGCPECNAGPKNSKHDFNDSSQLPRQWGHWHWDYKNPEVYYCKKCKEKYPVNSKYPMNNVETRHNRLGEKIKLTYWLDTAKDKKGFKKRYPKYYLNSQIDYFKQKWCSKQLYNLKCAYILSGDEEFAYKAAIIFDAFCEVFPHWLYMKNYTHGYLDYRPGIRMKSTYTRTNSRRGESWSGPIGMGSAYDVFFNSKGFAQYSKQIGVDLRVKYLTNIVKFIKPSMFGKGKLPDTNMDGWQQGCPGSDGLKTGKLLHDPRYMHRFADQMKRIPFEIYGSDGAYFEGSGYTCLQLNPMMKMRVMNGYTDPKGFVGPDGTRIENWWYPMGHYEEFHRKAYNLQRELQLPTGGGVVYNDAGGGFPSASYIQQTNKPRSFNVMKQGLKHVVLGDGVGEDQIQTHMLFGIDSKHGHSDTMSMQIFAKGHYMVDDITYPKHRMRSAYGGIKLHNTGVIDGRGHAQAPIGEGKPSLYEPRFNGLAAVRVNGENMYPGNDYNVFERTLINVTVDPKLPYVVDLFRMNGGRKWREYMLQGSYRHHATGEMSIPTKKLPGDRPLMRKGAKWDDSGKGDVKYDDRYGLFTNVRAGAKGTDFKLTYTLKNTWRESEGKPKDLYIDPAKPAVGMVNHFIGMPTATPMLTEIPRRVDKPGSTMDMEQMPQLIFRDTGMNGESQFICVHEPFAGKPAIKKVSRLKSAKNVIALLVDFLNGRQDLVLISADNSQLKWDAHGVKTDAKMAVVSKVSGKEHAWMIGGTYLNANNAKLTQPKAGFNGKIVKSFRKWSGDSFDGFEISGDIPAGDDLAGAWVMVDCKGEQEKFYDRIINSSFDEWYQKYHSRSKRRYEDEKKKNPQSEYVLGWEANQRRWEQGKKAGAGWSFEIKEVVRKGDRTFIITKEDHGLKIDGQLTQELFMPNRKLEGAVSSWWINTAASTLPMKNMGPEQLIIKPQELSSIKKKLMPYPQDGNRYWRYINPDDPRKFETELVIDVTGADNTAPSDSKPGIIHLLAGVENGELKNIKGYAGASEGDMRQYIFKPKGGPQYFKGRLKVPKDGIYTIYYRAGGNGELIIDGKVVSPKNRYHAAPYPRVINLKLKAGSIPVEFWSTMSGSKYWSANNEISWEGPGIKRRHLEFSDFVYSQKELDSIAQNVVVNKLGVDDEQRYAGIKKFYLTAMAPGGGEIYLNGKVIGTTKDNRMWNHSLNLQKGDVLVLKAQAPKNKDYRGAAFGCLYKGKSYFKTQDCLLTAEIPAAKFFEDASMSGSFVKAVGGSVGKEIESDGSLKFYQCKPVWHEDAQTVWLKYVVK